MTQTDRSNKLQEVILRHIPRSGEVDSWGRVRAWGYSRDLEIAYRDQFERFSVSPDVEKLEELYRLLHSAAVMSDSLSDETKRVLHVTRLERSERIKYGDIGQFSREIDWLARRVRQIRSWAIFRNPASKKRNWAAAAVAFECRLIWGAEEWIRLNGEWPKWDNDFDQVLGLSPRRQKHNAPGPFGRFIEDIFECFEITARDGHPVSAATALESLAQLEGP